MENLQEQLNKLLGECRIEIEYQDEEAVSYPYDKILVLKPCGYHKSRALCSTFAIQDDIIERINDELGSILICEDSRKLARKFRKKSKPPAGGWYLVKEQREWLKKQIYGILSKKPNDSTVYILEAGVASYIHHYTYVSIIKDVLVKLKKTQGIKINVHVCVFEKCSYPLYQIRAVAKMCKYDKEDAHYPNPDDEFLDFLESSEILDFEQIKVRLFQTDLQNPKNKFKFKFDIITEHFLTSVVRNLDKIKLVREAYAKSFLNEGGSLLCASGVEKSHALEYDNYMQVHDEDFELMNSETVWDPYGMDTSEIMGILEGGKKVVVDFGNTLFNFQKKIKSKK